VEPSAFVPLPLMVERPRPFRRRQLLKEEAVAAEPLDEPAGGIADSVRGQGLDGEGTAQGAREMPRAVSERPEVDDAALDQG